jgi:hypothetical protein
MGMTVSIRVHKNGATLPSVAPGAPNLLVIPFQTAWQGSVNHGSNIQLARHEFFLHSSSPLGIQPCVVAGYSKLAYKIFRQAVRLLARRGIHDGWPVLLFEQDLPSELRPL